ncbi:AAA family ATPase [Leeuwenhoekiella sp. H156]|uniref:AAA family ATPase n=1 Tax=Leeuwenhoekiella sp. H156 TaxID=3450128 RepID=UPI003FA41A1B
MMKITFRNNYISIKKFDPIEISDFSILTGINGAGKTHFLQAINNGNILIDKISNNEIQYYNYNSFSIEAQNNDGSQSNWNNGRNQIIQKLSVIKQNLNKKYLADKDIFQQIIFNLIQQKGYNFETFFKENSGLHLLKKKELDRNQFEMELMNNHNNLNSQVFNFLLDLNNRHDIDRSKYDIEVLKDLFKKEEKQFNSEYEAEFRKILLESDKDLYDYLSNSNLVESLSKLGINDFETSDFLLGEIAEKEKNYQFLKLQNSFNKTLNIENNKNLPYLTEQEFINTYGISPVEEINQVLTEYDTNGYFLQSNNLDIQLGVDRANFPINLQLINKKKGYSTSFSQLSSGEKTLITLSLLIYKSKKKFVPRILLLDEIDSALHPTMITRLLNVLKNIFVEKKKLKIIMATHSVTSIALAEENSIYVIDNSNESLIRKEKKEHAIKILSEGFITIEEGITIFDQFSDKKISIFTEGNNISYIKKAIEILEPSLINSVEIVEKLKDRTGKNQLSTLFDFFKRTNHNNKILFVYDCDVKTDIKEENKTYGFIFDQNVKNTKVLKGIENLFEEGLFTEEYYITKSKEDGGLVSNLDKPKFEDFILKQNSKTVFENFSPLISKIKSLNESE